MRKIIFFSIIFLTVSVGWAAQPKDAAFVKSINDQGEGTNFDDAILLNDQCDFSECETDECLQKVFSETIFREEIKYIADKFGRPDIDWRLTGETPVAAYVWGVGRYYDDLVVHITATGKNQTFHFDITSSIDAVKKKENEFIYGY